MSASSLYLCLVALQAAHSVEEYFFRLYADFPPAQLVSRLFSSDLRVGFLIANCLLVTVGVLCYLGPVRRNWPSATVVMWIWSVVELLNGIGHPLRSLLAGRYTAGTGTALLLLVNALLLIRALISSTSGASRAAS